MMRPRLLFETLAMVMALAFFGWARPAECLTTNGRWQLLLKNAGIASMHTAVTHYNNVVFLDRTNIGPSQINLPNGVCRDNPADLTLTHDCTAHSVLFTPDGPNTAASVRPLFVFTDTWCSSGQFFADGTLVHTGGDSDGLYKVRKFAPCPSSGNCDWVEEGDATLQDGRWYASNQLLPDGRQIVVGGRSAFTYEFIPRKDGETKVALSLLQETNDDQNDNYYPFVHLLPDGNLYIFANRDSIVYNYQTQTVVKKLPTIPGESRNYPSAGSSVMLPLSAAADNFGSVEVLVCGGAQKYCFLYPAASPEASETCGRITVTSDDPKWAMETMPLKRSMGDMLFLPTGEVLIINGAKNGCQGWGNANNPVLSPVVYNPDAADGARFTTLAATTIPRVYHSTANLLPDGRVLVAGSNTHQFYTFTGDLPTELRVEAYVPDYVDAGDSRPVISAAPDTVAFGKDFTVQVTLNNGGEITAGNVAVSLISSPFTTHSYSQGLRFLKLEVTGVAQADGNANAYNVAVTGPPGATVAPPAYYMLWVVNGGIPCTQASWVQITY